MNKKSIYISKIINERKSDTPAICFDYLLSDKELEKSQNKLNKWSKEVFGGINSA